MSSEPATRSDQRFVRTETYGPLNHGDSIPYGKARYEFLCLEHDNVTGLDRLKFWGGDRPSNTGFRWLPPDDPQLLEILHKQET